MNFCLLLVVAFTLLSNRCDLTVAYEIVSNEIPLDHSIDDDCQLQPELKAEIQSYKSVVENISRSVLNGQYKGQVYNALANFVDDFGSRMAGTKNLDAAIDYMKKQLNLNGLENVHDEPVVFDGWFRGNESATLIKPRHYNMQILGLGYSVSTPPEGITADVLVVNSFDELTYRSKEARGKIVVYNEEYISYGKTVQYRSTGAIEAAKYGAVAALVRSITPYSIYSPHTGMMHYDDNIPKIPFAAITVEDAEMLRRMSERGLKIKIDLKMSNRHVPGTKSRNLVGEIRGSTKKERVVLVSGHLDSWDVGQGAMDDGGGAFISWYSLAVLKQLGLRPKRTMRAVLWTAEELGLLGAKEYAKAHNEELKNFDLVMESDEGTFTPQGIEFAGSTQAECIVKEVLKLMESINATEYKKGSSTNIGSDIVVMTSLGVPGASLINKNEKYFYYHHTNADMMTVENSDDLDKCVALWAAFSYIIADISQDLRG